MKIFYSMLCLGLLIVGCKAEPDTSATDAANALFEKNSETALKSILDWESESPEKTDFSFHFFGGKK